MNYNYKTLSEDEIKKILETSETYYPKFNSIQTIESYYKTNYQYFNEYSVYWYNKDINYYNSYIKQYYDSSNVHIHCPFCSHYVIPNSIRKITTGGIVCILAGLILTPIIIGILIIFIGMGMKETTTYCSYCKMKI